MLRDLFSRDQHGGARILSDSYCLVCPHLYSQPCSRFPATRRLPHAPPPHTHTTYTDRRSMPTRGFSGHPDSWRGACLSLVSLYKIFVCSFRDCALINTIIGTKHLLHCSPLYCAIHIAQCMVSPRPPCFLQSTYNIGAGIGNIV